VYFFTFHHHDNPLLEAVLRAGLRFSPAADASGRRIDGGWFCRIFLAFRPKYLAKQLPGRSRKAGRN
jgi:hypothetical protein